jgi:membrane protease YdiL (CAAX protease family)
VSLAGQILAGIVLVSVLLAEFVLGPWLAEGARRRIARGERDARVHLYRRTVAYGWGFALVVVAVLGLGGLSASEIGFGSAELGPHRSVFVGLVGGSLVSLVLARFRSEPRTVGDIDLFRPRGRRERRWFAGTALTAGITEEITFRALPILLFRAVLPGDGRVAAVLLSAVLFGLAHRYQGPAGMVATGVLGVVFGSVYVASGSLWPSMLLHVLLDLRLLLLPTPKEVEPP